MGTELTSVCGVFKCLVWVLFSQLQGRIDPETGKPNYVNPFEERLVLRMNRWFVFVRWVWSHAEELILRRIFHRDPRKSQAERSAWLSRWSVTARLIKFATQDCGLWGIQQSLDRALCSLLFKANHSIYGFLSRAAVLLLLCRCIESTSFSRLLGRLELFHTLAIFSDFLQRAHEMRLMLPQVSFRGNRGLSVFLAHADW